jgi:hypothetical protein
MAGRYRRHIPLILSASLALIPIAADAQNPRPDKLCELLFDAYIARPVKESSTTVMAAAEIVADRGRETGFWRTVLEKLKTNDEHSEIGCVRVLGMMLAADAGARDAIRLQKETGEFRSAQPPTVYLGPEVVAALIERGQQADRFRIDHYTIALVRARAPETRDFFLSILRAKTGPSAAAAVLENLAYRDSTRFHAAVGLAQLGDRDGINWLIAHSEDTTGTVSNAWPYGAQAGGSLGDCCIAALRQLSGERNLTTRAEWEAWSKTADPSQLARHAVVLRDS